MLSLTTWEDLHASLLYVYSGTTTAFKTQSAPNLLLWEVIDLLEPANEVWKNEEKVVTMLDFK